MWLDGTQVAAGERQKPMQFLRVLVVNGGCNVSIATIANALWPDADGDMAKRALETALHRLRHIVGETAIVRQGNCLSLNANACWLDLWAVDSLLAHDLPSANSATQIERLLALYRGSLLTAEEFPWAVQQRARWQSRFLRAIIDYAEACEREGAWVTAAAIYKKALESETVVEDLYRRLMLCYRRLNRFVDAVVVYRRCREVLATALAVAPSGGLTELHSEIVGLLREAENTTL